MKERIALASVLAASLLLASPVLAQNTPGGSSPRPSDPNIIMLAPRTPEGGVYGAQTASPAPPASEAPSGASGETSSPAPATPSGSPGPETPGAATVAQPSAVPPPPPPVATEGTPSPFVAPPPLSRRALLLRERLRLLNTSLPPLADASRRSRITEAVLQMASGTAIGALGFLFPGGSGASDLRPWFWTMGGVAILSGVVDLAWVPARERLTAQYMRMPFATGRERRARAQFGEYALNEMAADGTRRRILGAVTGALVPIGLLGIMYRDPIFNGTPYTVGPQDYLMIGFAAVGVVTSLINLFTRSQEERLHDMYWQQIRMREAELNTP